MIFFCNIYLTLAEKEKSCTKIMFAEIIWQALASPFKKTATLKIDGKP